METRYRSEIRIQGLVWLDTAFGILQFLVNQISLNPLYISFMRKTVYHHHRRKEKGVTKTERVLLPETTYIALKRVPSDMQCEEAFG